MRSAPILLFLAILSGGCADDGSAPGTDGSVGGCPQALQCGSDAGVPESGAHLVHADWLAERLPEGQLQLLDVRGREAFAQGAIDGALHLEAGALRATVDGVPGQVAPQQSAAQTLATAGVDPTRPLVVYDAGGQVAAPRVVWTLRYYLHMDVRMLDAGVAGWGEAGHSLVPGTPGTAGSYAIDGIDPALRVDADWVMAALDDPAVVLVDARSDSEYAAGHIPSALSFDWPRNLEGPHLKSPQALAAMYAKIDPAATVVAYCQTGSRASMAWFALQHAGFQDVRIYDGSMAEWGSDPNRPRQ